VAGAEGREVHQGVNDIPTSKNIKNLPRNGNILYHVKITWQVRINE